MKILRTQFHNQRRARGRAVTPRRRIVMGDLGWGEAEECGARPVAQIKMTGQSQGAARSRYARSRFPHRYATLATSGPQTKSSVTG